MGGATGYYEDREIGLYFTRTRPYDPLTGHFLGTDPDSFAAGDANLYRYAGNDPVNQTDPSGRRVLVPPCQWERRFSSDRWPQSDAGDGRAIFKNHQIEFIVLDEVHTYHGLLGTDVACLMRRLRKALHKANPSAKPLFIGTSATLQAGEEGDPRRRRRLLQPSDRPADAAGVGHHGDDESAGAAGRRHVARRAGIC